MKVPALVHHLLSKASESSHISSGRANSSISLSGMRSSVDQNFHPWVSLACQRAEVRKVEGQKDKGQGLPLQHLIIIGLLSIAESGSITQAGL